MLQLSVILSFANSSIRREHAATGSLCLRPPSQEFIQFKPTIRNDRKLQDSKTRLVELRMGSYKPIAPLTNL